MTLGIWTLTEMSTFEVTASTGGGVNIKNTVSLAKECQELIITAAGLVKIRDQVLLPIMHYLAYEADKKVTLSSDPIMLTWEIMRQGSFMCELLNQVQPGVITDVYLPVPPITSGHFRDINSRQNISAFVKACRDMFFMKDDELFNAGDLYKEDFITFTKALKLCQFYLSNKLRVSHRNSITLKQEDLLEEDAKLFQLHDNKPEGEECSENLMKKSKKRDMLIQELVASERVYVDDLAKLNQFSEAVKSSHAISQKAFNAIFANLKALLNFQRKFQIQLENEVARKNDMDLGRLFQDNQTGFQVYEPFCINHKNSIKTLQEQMFNFQKQPDLYENMGDLSAYLIKPIQRITKYHLFFRDLLKESKKHGYDDVSKLQTAIKVIKDIASSINERQREVENAAAAEYFYNHFPPGKVTAEKTGKLHLFAPSVTVKLGENMKSYRLYVFEKRVVMCSERERIGPFWIKNQLATSTIQSVSLRDSGLDIDPFEVEVCCKDEEKIASWSILLKNEQQANLWYNNLRIVAGLPVMALKETEEEIAEIISVQEEVSNKPVKPESAMTGSKEYIWIIEFMEEYYMVTTDYLPTLSELKTAIRTQIELEYSFNCKQTNLIHPYQNASIQFKMGNSYIHLQDDKGVAFAAKNHEDPIYLRLYRPKPIRVRITFRDVLYAIAVEEIETLAELKSYIYETIKDDYQQINANIEAIPVPKSMRLYLREHDDKWSLLLYDNDLESALENNKNQIDLRL